MMTTMHTLFSGLKRGRGLPPPRLRCLYAALSSVAIVLAALALVGSGVAALHLGHRSYIIGLSRKGISFFDILEDMDIKFRGIVGKLHWDASIDRDITLQYDWEFTPFTEADATAPDLRDHDWNRAGFEFVTGRFPYAIPVTGDFRIVRELCWSIRVPLWFLGTALAMPGIITFIRRRRSSKAGFPLNAYRSTSEHNAAKKNS